ncbi:MAG: nuclear transport factor 2 family protein [Bacteroidota bacterium]
MNNQIKEVISEFALAIEAQDTDRLDEILHSDFVVMANRLKGDNGMTVMPRAMYMGAMDAGKIGGAKYETQFLNTHIFQHTAVVEVLLSSSTSADMHLFLSLVLNDNNEWQIVCDLPVVIPN